MEKDENGWYKVKLHRVGESTRTGNIYPLHLLQETLSKSRRQMYGEVSNPRLEFGDNDDPARRVLSVIHDYVSHEIDWTRAAEEDGFIVAPVRPSGPYGHVLEKALAEGSANFALRGIVNFSHNNPKEVTYLQLVTFDLTDKPL